MAVGVPGAGPASVGDDKLVAAPVLVAAVWKVAPDDDGDLPTPEEQKHTLSISIYVCYTSVYVC